MKKKEEEDLKEMIELSKKAGVYRNRSNSDQLEENIYQVGVLLQFDA